MNRKSFLKLLGVGAAAAIVVPKIIPEKPGPEKSTETEGLIPYLERTSDKPHYIVGGVMGPVPVSSLRMGDIVFINSDMNAYIVSPGPGSMVFRSAKPGPPDIPIKEIKNDIIYFGNRTFI